jgi:glycosyltransferase involved in cell wall biosynthesis
MNGLRLLALTPFPPNRSATNGGARVMGELLTRLAERNRVAVLTLRGSEEPPLDPELARLADDLDEVGRAPLPEGWPRRAGIASAQARGVPRWPAEWRVPELDARLERLAAAWKPNVVHVHYHVMGQYLTALQRRDAKRILVEYEAHPAPVRSPLARRLEEKAWRRYETRLLRTVDAAVAFTDRDAKVLRALGSSARIEVIPFGVPLPERPLDPVGADRAVVFVGNFEHRPNVDAALRLARAVFPRLADARLVLVGSRPPEEVRSLANARVEVFGSVEDVTPFLDRASVVALPLREGGGMRVKALEALAAGKAVVATRLAVEGLRVADGRHLVLAESDDDLAAAIGALLDSPERRRALGAAARRWAEAHATWDARIEEHEALCRSLLDEGRR